jgi:acyl transferase domain-containing protein/NADPH:quinone reductase-like Zn-dependent oxidoreductase/short-subunit dehydrogenase/acyl carrier protein
MYEDPIAIIGASCRFPGAENLARFWDVLSSGRDAVTEIPDGRWAKKFFFNPNPAERGRSYTWAAGIIGNVDRFDAAFFGISPREAEQIDPQQRLLLELAWEALEDAGIPAGRIAGGNGGVYIGASSRDYGDIRTGDPAGGDAYFMTGVTASILANRISYIFDLHGPSFTVDTACSSSLVALDLACRAIRDGRVPLAVVGGVNLLLTPYPFVGFCRASMLSPTGRCHAFDASADGYVRAEGGGVVILKTLSQARADGDHVRGLILGAGVNSDGRTIGLSLPSREAQSRLLQSVYAESGIHPDALSFIEAHGTGTPAGDPMEMAAVGEALGGKRAAPLPLGSVKTNIGHLESASGMAGLLKTMLGLEHRLIPPSLHFETPNPNIPFADLNLRVVTRATPLGRGDDRLIAGVNSFGFGGANAHAILASAPPTAALVGRSTSGARSDALAPLLLSARSEAALRALARPWSDMLAEMEPDQAGPVIRAAARHRDHHQYRLVARGDRPLDIADALDSFALSGAGSFVTTGPAAASGKVAFVYTGNGVQRPGMARDALAHSAVFRDAVAELDRILTPLLGWSVLRSLEGDDDPLLMARTDVAQPLLFAVQVGITAALRAQGIDASAHAGHSVGEIAAAWAAGALSLEDACIVIVERSRQQQRCAGCGGMAVLGLGAAEAGAVLARLSGGLEIAAINSSKAVTIAGPRAALERLASEAARESWRYTRLDLDYAFHSAALDFIEDDLVAGLDGIAPRACADRFVSTVDGGPISGAALDPLYWWRNIREPVRFADAIATMIADGARIFVEIGPNPALLSYVRDALKIADVAGRTIGTLTHKGLAEDPFPAIAAECHVAGAGMSGAAIFDGQAADPRRLPAYPWQRERYWVTPTSETATLESPVGDHPLLGFRRDPDVWRWTGAVGVSLQPWLDDHRLEGVPILPGAALLDIAAAAARAMFPGAPGLDITGLEIPRAMVLDPGVTRELLVWRDGDGKIRIESRRRLADEPRTLHAVAGVAAGSGVAPGAPVPLDGFVRRIEAAELYRLADRLGLNYGPGFRTVRSVSMIGDGAALVEFQAGATPAAEQDFVLDPMVFDGALQGCLALLADRADPIEGESFIPVRFGRVRVFAPYGRRPATARIAIDRIGVRAVSASIGLFDQAGDWIAAAEECWFQRVRLSKQDPVSGMIFRMDRIAAPRAEDCASPPFDIEAALGAAVRGDAGTGSASDSGQDSRLLFEAYLASRSHAVLRDIAPAGQAFRSESLVLSGAVAEEAAPLLAWMLWTMERHGAASAAADGWRLADDDTLPEPTLIWRTILADHPELAPELALAASADFAALLRGGAIDAAPPAALVEHMLHGSVPGRRALAVVCDAVAAVARDWPDGRPLRVLEMGAGAGILTRRLLGRLAGRDGALVYVASDPDSQAMPRLAAAVADHDGARAERWTPGDGASAAPAGRFDLVISMYGLTRQGLNSDALARVRDALAPGGVLLTVEPEPNEAWDAAFGRRADWWHAGVDRDFPISSVVGGAGLAETLRRAGLPAPSVTTIDAGLWPVSILASKRQAGSPPAVAAADGIIIIARRGDPLAHHVLGCLGDAAASARIIDPPEVSDGAELLALLGAAGATPPRILFLPAFDRPTEEGAAGAAARMTAILTVARLAADASDHAVLWIVTRDAQSPDLIRGTDGGQAKPSPAEAAVWGLGRTITNELSQIECRLVDLPAHWGADRQARALAAELADPDAEREIVWGDAGRGVLRLRRGLKRPAKMTASVTLDIAQPGLLDTLCWRPAVARAPGAGEIEIETRAAGLNFRDVMWAMGLLPEEALMDGFSGPTLGLECTGIVSATGPGVEGFRVGDRVMAMAPAALASRVITAAHAVVPMPEGLGFEAGATLPVASLTVLYGLDHLAQLRAGEWVLIHGAAGGVGLMAIQFAQHRGATIIATAGSDAKRAFLRHLGVDHILDSRDLAFADQVRAITSGLGVDVVLNSLSGEAMERSIGLLKPFGRFVELGKRDFMMDTRLGLRALRQNIAYFAVDVDRLPLARPDLAQALLRQVAALVDEGALRPLPYRAYPFADAPEAFRLMQGAGHIGKIVLTPDDLMVAEAPVPAPVARGDRTYLVTGGLSGFGLETARWLADRGARSLALISRRGADAPEARDALVEFLSRGIAARAFACDVADPAALAVALDEIRADMPPLGGIVHAAMVVDDGLAVDLTAERIARVLRPKLDGALNLDRLTRRDEIELFLLFSSATTLLGAPGQGSYVAANMALEAVARGRAAEGLPALAVAFGPIADVGFLAAQDTQRDSLIRRLATAPIAARDALDALPRLLSSGLPVVALAPVRWDAANQHLPILRTPVFSEVVSGTQETGSVDLRERLVDMSPEDARDVIVGLLTDEAARILSFAPDRIDPNRPLSEFGMDSLMAVELRLALETKLGVDVPLVSLSDNTSLSILAKRIARDLSKGPGLEPFDAMMLRHESSTIAPPPAAETARNRVGAVEVTAE